MPTLQVLAERYGYNDLAVLFPEADIPILTGAQRQGDVLVLPTAPRRTLPDFGRRQRLDAGVVVVGVKTAGHTHTLFGDGTVRRRHRPKPGQDETQGDGCVAWLHVPEGGAAFLMHSEEHGALGIGPGVYELRRQQDYDEAPVGQRRTFVED